MSQHHSDISPTSNAPRGTSADRPVTSKPRGVCKYYNTDRGCYAGNRCKFLHGEAERLTPYDKTKVCRFHAAGYCRRGESCWFLHVDPSKESSGSSVKATLRGDEDESLCSICYDKPVTYGLLAGCSHVFCISCIKNWRGNEGKSDDIIQAGTTKTCPMCRTPSRFVTPSAYYYPEGHPRKSEVIEKYKASMARVKCKYFERSKPSKRFCPFGKDCFYKHENADGTPFVFEHGASHYMNRGPSRRSRDDIDWETESDAGFEFMLNTISQVFGGSHDMRTALRAVASAFSVDFQPLPYDGPDMVSEEDSDEGEGEGDEEEEDDPYMPLALLASNGADAEVDGAAMEEIPAASDGHSEDHGGDAPMHAARSIFDLDPTIPEFVPSFQLNLRPSRNAASPSYLYDRLRPLPHNPILAVHHEYEGGIERTSTETRSSLRELSERFASDLEQAGAMDQQTSAIDLTSLLLASPTQSPYIDHPSSLAIESPDVTLPEAPPEHPEEPPAGPQSEVESAFLQDTDPPFMTDGRGRVVWSNATSSRGCEGRRVRAASSSIVHPHIVKPNADLLAAGDDHASPSNHGSPMHHPTQLPQQQLVRRRSLPSVSTSTPIEDKRSAEFITDGRGRVVFASNNQSH